MSDIVGGFMESRTVEEFGALRFASWLNRKVVYIHRLDGSRSCVGQKERMAVGRNAELAWKCPRGNRAQPGVYAFLLHLHGIENAQSLRSVPVGETIRVSRHYLLAAVDRRDRYRSFPNLRDPDTA